MGRKIIISLLASFYLLLASGVSVNIHYCMGRLASMQFAHESSHKEDACGKCGMDKKKNACCHDEFKVLKITSEHNVSASEFYTSFFEGHDYRMLLVYFHPSIQGLSDVPKPAYHAPPPQSLNKQYRINRVFLI